MNKIDNVFDKIRVIINNLITIVFLIVLIIFFVFSEGLKNKLVLIPFIMFLVSKLLKYERYNIIRKILYYGSIFLIIIEFMFSVI